MERLKDIQDAIYCMKVFADQSVCEECGYYPNCDHTTQGDMAKVAISALEKQIPRKPKITIHKAIDGGTNEELTAHLKHCPCCFDNREIPYFDSLIDKGSAYCRRCGQAIDWSDNQ